MTVEFALQLVYGIDMSQSRSYIALITFSSTATVNFPLNRYFDKESVINAMRFAYSGGRTNIQDALQLVNSQVFIPTNGDRNSARNIVVLVSDGYANVNEGNTISEATNVKNRGALIYTIALGTNPDLSTLNAVSSNPDSDYVFRLRNPSEVQTTVDNVLGELCR